MDPNKIAAYFLKRCKLGRNVGEICSYNDHNINTVSGKITIKVQISCY